MEIYGIVILLQSESSMKVKDALVQILDIRMTKFMNYEIFVRLTISP